MIDLAAACLLFAVCAWGMAGFELRMARYHTDDSPVHYAHAFATPERYARDVTIGVPTHVVLPSRVATSAMVWVPALLWKHAGVHPFGVTRVLTWLQAAALAASMYLLATVLTARRDLALMVAVFSMVAAPWVWSPANYGNDAAWNFVPYPANLATGVLVAAITAAMQGRNALALVLLTAGGLVHPLLGLHVAVILLVFRLAAGRDMRMPERRYFLSLAAAVVIFMLPAVYGALMTPDPLPSSVIIPALRLNAHIFPWRVPGWWGESAQQTVAFLLLAGTVWTIADVAARARYLWYGSLAAATAFSVAHLAGAAIESPSLLTLVGLRAWMWPVLVSVPVVCLGFWRTFECGSVPARFAAAALLVMPFVAGRYALPLPLVFALAATWIGTVAAGRLRVAFEAVSWLAVAGWVALAMAVPSAAAGGDTLLAHMWRALAGAGDVPDLRVAVLLPAAVALLLAAATSRRSPDSSRVIRVSAIRWAGVSAAVIIAAAGVRARAADATREGTSDRYLLEAERWARDHTPPAATFLILEDGWRTMAERPAVEPFTRESYAYVAPTAAEQWRLRLLAHYGIDVVRATAQRGPALVREQRERFRAVGEEDLLRFSETTGATHAVIPVCYPQTGRTSFDLPLVFQNPCYRVYVISASGVDAARRDASEMALSLLADARFASGFGPGSQHPALATGGGAIVPDAAGRFGHVLRVEPTTRATLPAPAIDLARGTFAVWARLRMPVGDYADVLRVNAGSDLYLYLTGGAFHLLVGGTLIGAAPVTVDQEWHHYAVVWDDRAQHLYIDGQLRLSGTASPSARGSSLVALGWLGDRDGEQWSGDFGHVATFTRPLSAAQIRSLAAHPRRP